MPNALAYCDLVKIGAESFVTIAVKELMPNDSIQMRWIAKKRSEFHKTFFLFVIDDGQRVSLDVSREY